jgi:hypothetical protein
LLNRYPQAQQVHAIRENGIGANPLGNSRAIWQRAHLEKQIRQFMTGWKSRQVEISIYGHTNLSLVAEHPLVNSAA